MSLPYLHFIKTNKPCTSDESFTSTPRLKCGVWEEASPAGVGGDTRRWLRVGGVPRAG